MPSSNKWDGLDAEQKTSPKSVEEESVVRSSSAHCFDMFFVENPRNWQSTQKGASTFLAPDLSEWDFCRLRLEKAQTWALDFNRYLCLGAWELRWSGFQYRVGAPKSTVPIWSVSMSNFPEMKSSQKAAFAYICLYVRQAFIFQIAYL